MTAASSSKNPTLQGGQIHITIVTPDKVDEAAKVIRVRRQHVHEIHNETLCSVTSYLDGNPLGGGSSGGQAEGGNEGQHPYDTSPHAQEHQNEARSSATGGTIIIEIHNETRLIENRYFSSLRATEAEKVPEATAATQSKRKPASSVKVTKGVSKKAPAKKRLAIEAAKPPNSSAARAARQARRAVPATVAD